MNDLDDRLRTTLHQLADTVPASQHARADLDRRLVSRGRRRPLLVAAAAAVVIAGVAVPVALNQSGGPSRGSTATRPTSVTQSSNPPSLPGNAHVLGSFDENGIHKSVALTVDKGNPGDTWCAIEVVSQGQKASREPDCYMVPLSWSDPPGSFVFTYGLFNVDVIYSGPVPNLLVFVTAPAVASLEVGDGAGGQVPVRQIVARPGATFYLAEFPDTPAGFRYTARDAAGNMLEDAIT
jgi:hypothetical protein